MLVGGNRLSLDRFDTIPKDPRGSRTDLLAEILAFPHRYTVGNPLPTIDIPGRIECFHAPIFFATSPSFATLETADLLPYVRTCIYPQSFVSKYFGSACGKRMEKQNGQG